MMVLPVTYEQMKAVQVTGSGAPDVVEISEADGFFINRTYTQDFRIRNEVYEKIKEAAKKLPAGMFYMFYEAYRPLKRQVQLWDMVTLEMKKQYPEADAAKIAALTETFVANPYDGIGSGHQACCAIDVTLCDKDGKEFSMGTACQEFHPHAVTQHPDISAESVKHRRILLDTLEGAGFANYPAEWWHFSYGDHQWAVLKGKSECPFGPVDI